MGQDLLVHGLKLTPQHCVKALKTLQHRIKLFKWHKIRLLLALPRLHLPMHFLKLLKDNPNKDPNIMANELLIAHPHDGRHDAFNHFIDYLLVWEFLAAVEFQHVCHDVGIAYCCQGLH